jgi:hypothetical protein
MRLLFAMTQTATLTAAPGHPIRAAFAHRPLAFHRDWSADIQLALMTYLGGLVFFGTFIA